MLNKSRLENLSDGLFAIVFTLLVIEIKVPEMHGAISNGELWHTLLELGPLFVGYAVSFVVLAMFWLSHNFFYGHFVKEINRQLIMMNLLYLSFISLIPFSAHLVGRYPDTEIALFIYGLNVLAIGIANILIISYAYRSSELDTSHVSRRLFKQAIIRAYVTPIFTLFGMIAALGAPAFALILYAFPIVFNIIPGTLDTLERLFGFELGK
jgi:uncharacterized membrane protein